MEELSKPAPCDGCEHSEDCKTKLLACKQFSHYVNSGRVVYGDKMPTREIWNRIFVDDDDSIDDSLGVA